MKVRSSEEKLAAERKEKAEKVRVYREVTSKIFTKVTILLSRDCHVSRDYHVPVFLFTVTVCLYSQRAAGDHDEEALKLTRDILQQNPDIATLWNYRREIVAPTLSSP